MRWSTLAAIIVGVAYGACSVQAVNTSCSASFARRYSAFGPVGMSSAFCGESRVASGVDGGKDTPVCRAKPVENKVATYARPMWTQCVRMEDLGLEGEIDEDDLLGCRMTWARAQTCLQRRNIDTVVWLGDSLSAQLALSMRCEARWKNVAPYLSRPSGFEATVDGIRTLVVAPFLVVPARRKTLVIISEPTQTSFKTCPAPMCSGWSILACGTLSAIRRRPT